MFKLLQLHKQFQNPKNIIFQLLDSSYKSKKKIYKNSKNNKTLLENDFEQVLVQNLAKPPTAIFKMIIGSSWPKGGTSRPTSGSSDPWGQPTPPGSL
jgi:hypothetical protein